MGVSQRVVLWFAFIVGLTSTASHAGIYLFDKYGRFYKVEGQSLSGPFGMPRSSKEGEAWLPGGQYFLTPDPQSSPTNYQHRFAPYRSRVDTDLTQAVFEYVNGLGITEGESWSPPIPKGHRLEQALSAGRFRAFVTRDNTGGVGLFVLRQTKAGLKLDQIDLGENVHIARVHSAPLGNGLVLNVWGGYLLSLTMNPEGQFLVEHIGPAGKVIDAHVGIIREGKPISVSPESYSPVRFTEGETTQIRHLSGEESRFGLVSQVLTDDGEYEFRIHDPMDLKKTYPLWLKVLDKTIDPPEVHEISPMGMVSNDQVYNPGALIRASNGEGATEHLAEWEGGRVLNPPRAVFRKVPLFIDLVQGFKCDYLVNGNATRIAPSN
jgi:hypothetical protein